MVNFIVQDKKYILCLFQVPLVSGQTKVIPKPKADALIDGIETLEELLEGKNYIAGDELSIADFGIIDVVSTANRLIALSAGCHPNITAWYTRIKTLPYYKEANAVGLEKFIEFIESRMK